MPKALATLAGQALACIEDPAVIEKILTHLKEKADIKTYTPLPGSRAAPPVGMPARRLRTNHTFTGGKKGVYSFYTPTTTTEVIGP